MNKHCVTIAMLLGMCATASADAWYIRGDFGYSWVTSDQSSKPSFDLSIDPVPLGQLGFGYVLTPYVRFDVTGSLTGGRDVTIKCKSPTATCSALTSGDTTIDTSTLFANVYYEMASLWTVEPTRWHPYIGLGLGSAYQAMNTVHMTLDSGSGSMKTEIEGNGQWQFAWRTMLGVAVTLTDNLLFDMSYVYMGAGEAESGSSAGAPISVDMNAQEVYIGLRQQF